MEKSNISWKRVLLFMVVATLVTNIFRFDIFSFSSDL